MTDGDGLYVTIEGIDGSGTTSVSDRLAERFDCVKTAEPSDLWTGKVAREAFEDRDVSDLTRFFMFMADRADHCEKIVGPATEAGNLVISDRGPDSTRAYQYHTTDINIHFIEHTLEQTITPDLTILLDLSIGEAYDRAGDQDDAFDDLGLQSDVATRYRTIAGHSQRIIIVDASQPLPDVVDEAAAIIEENL